MPTPAGRAATPRVVPQPRAGGSPWPTFVSSTAPPGGPDRWPPPPWPLSGADVIKVESVTRPDNMRFASTRPPTADRWWEWSPIFHAANAGKRGVTFDLSRPEGSEMFERLLQTADVLVENFTPRVMEQFGFGWDRVHSLNDR